MPINVTEALREAEHKLVLIGQRLTQAEAELDALRAKAAMADEQYGEGKVRSHAYWKARYDAIERESGETP